MTFHAPCGPTVYATTPEHIIGVFREKLGVVAKTWKCPCTDPRCTAHVVYASGGDGMVYFMATNTFQSEPPWPTMVMQNVEDLQTLLTSTSLLPAGDLLVYRMWLMQGLKEVLVAALEPGPAAA